MNVSGVGVHKVKISSHRSGNNISITEDNVNKPKGFDLR